MSKRFQLCVTNHAGKTYIMRHIKLDEGERLVEAGKAELIRDTNTGWVIGFQLRDVPKCEAPSVMTRAQRRTRCADKPTFVPKARLDRSESMLSRGQFEAVVGLCGKSRTMMEDEAAEKIRMKWRNPVAEPDYIELAHVKLDSFAPRYAA